MKRTFLLAFLITLAFSTTAYLCGTERRPVKVCKDTKAKALFKNNSIATHQLKQAVDTTVAEMVAFDALPVSV
jgi:hypothetical protein